MTDTQTKPKTKSATIIALLSRKKAASIDEICKTTSWQPHSVRAFLTDLRRKGYGIVREQRDKDGTAYRILAGGYGLVGYITAVRIFGRSIGESIKADFVGDRPIKPMNRIMVTHIFNHISTTCQFGLPRE